MCYTLPVAVKMVSAYWHNTLGKSVFLASLLYTSRSTEYSLLSRLCRKWRLKENQLLSVTPSQIIFKTIQIYCPIFINWWIYQYVCIKVDAVRITNLIFIYSWCHHLKVKRLKVNTDLKVLVPVTSAVINQSKYR